MINDKELLYSREEIRRQMLQILDDVFRRKNLVLDKDNSSYLTFIVNLVSALSADVLYYANFLFGESNLITAILPSTVYNWATYIDYVPVTGLPAKTKLAFYFPLESPFSLEIEPFIHYFSFGEVKFTPVNKIIVVNVGNSMEVREVVDPDSGTYIIVPSKIILRDDGKRVFTFQVDAINLYKVQYTYRLSSMRPYEFVDIPITLRNDEHLVGASVKVGGRKWQRGILVLSSGSDEVYDIYKGSTENQLVIRFGNGVFGKQPESSDVTIDLFVCNGKAGNVEAFTINSGPTLHSLSGIPVTYEVTNVVRAEGGKDYEKILDIKRNAIYNLRTRYRNVSQQDFEDDLPLNHPELYEDAKVILFRSDNFTNDIYVYLTLKDHSGKIIPSSTITVDDSTLQSDAIVGFNTVIKSIAPFDSHLNYYSPFTIVKDLERGIWKGYEISLHRRVLELKRNYYRNPPYPTTVSYEFDGKLTYSVDLVNRTVTFSVRFNSVSVGSQNYRLKARLVLRGRNGIVFMYSNNLSNGTLIFTHEYNSIDELQRLDLVELQLLLENTTNSNFMLIAAYSSVFEVFQRHIVYGPLYRTGNKLYLVGIPAIEKNYYDSLNEDEKAKLYDTIMFAINRNIYNERRRLYNTLPHIRFVRTVGKVYNVNYSKENYLVKGIVKSRNEAVQFPQLEVGDLLFISDPIVDDDPWQEHAGKVARYVGTENGERIFDIFPVPQGSTVKVIGEEELYVLVGTRLKKFVDELPLRVEVEVFVENPDIIGLEEKYKKVIVNHLNRKKPDESLKISELINRLHRIKGTKFVRFINPKHDFIYDFDYRTTLQKLNKMQYITFVPEKIHTTEESVKVIIRSLYDV